MQFIDSAYRNFLLPFSRTVRKSTADFKTLKLPEKIATLVLSVITGLGTCFLGAIPGLFTFCALVRNFKAKSGEIYTPQEKITNDIFKKSVSQKKREYSPNEIALISLMRQISPTKCPSKALGVTLEDANAYNETLTKKQEENFQKFQGALSKYVYSLASPGGIENVEYFRGKIKGKLQPLLAEFKGKPFLFLEFVKIAGLTLTDLNVFPLYAWTALQYLEWPSKELMEEQLPLIIENLQSSTTPFLLQEWKFYLGKDGKYHQPFPLADPNDYIFKKPVPQAEEQKREDPFSDFLGKADLGRLPIPSKILGIKESSAEIGLMSLSFAQSMNRKKLANEITKVISDTKDRELALKLRDLLLPLQSQPEKFLIAVFYIAKQLEKCLSSIVEIHEVLECLPWPNAALKEEQISYHMAEIVCSRGLIDTNGYISKNKVGCYQVILDTRDLFGEGDFHKNAQAIPPALLNGISAALVEAGYAALEELEIPTEKANQKDQKQIFGLKIEIPQFAETRFPAKMIAPLLPKLKDVPGLVSLDLQDIGTDHLVDGFGDEHFDLLLDVVKSNGFLVEFKANTQGMSLQVEEEFWEVVGSMLSLRGIILTKNPKGFLAALKGRVAGDEA